MLVSLDPVSMNCVHQRNRDTQDHVIIELDCEHAHPSGTMFSENQAVEVISPGTIHLVPGEAMHVVFYFHEMRAVPDVRDFVRVRYCGPLVTRAVERSRTLAVFEESRQAKRKAPWTLIPNFGGLVLNCVEADFKSK